MAPDRPDDDPEVPTIQSVAASPDFLAGRYRVRAELGRGGMGLVYRVHDVKLMACGTFPGFGPTTQPCTTGLTGNYYYEELFHGNGTSDIFETPEF